jgi:3-oxoacyl-[acyl-carrier protein] reductase
VKPVLENEIALVTGASRGIGQAVALELGSCGAFVVGTSTSQAGAEQVSRLFGERGIRGTGKVLDVTDSAAVNGFIQALEASVSAPSILVNNAAITRDNLLLRMKDEEWDEVLATDLTAVYRLCKACLRSMVKARRGRIINISSVVGLTGNPGQANYCAAKAGILGFTKALAREVGARGITVNAIAPGYIETDMTRELSEVHRQALLQTIPLSRAGTPEDVAHAAAFLASSAAAYITGTTLHVNGGMHMS